MSQPLKRGFIKFSFHRDGKTPDLNIVLKMSTYKLGNTLDDEEKSEDPSTNISL
jgi:hypothetical protein